MSLDHEWIVRQNGLKFLGELNLKQAKKHLHVFTDVFRPDPIEKYGVNKNWLDCE